MPRLRREAPGAAVSEHGDWESRMQKLEAVNRLLLAMARESYSAITRIGGPQTGPRGLDKGIVDRLAAAIAKAEAA